MDIFFLGHACFRLRGSQASLVTDPYSPGLKELPPKLSADIVTVSHAHEGHAYTQAVGGEPHIISRPGEYEIGGVIILGLPTFHDSAGGSVRGKNNVYLIEMDEISICHLGDLGHALDGATIEEMGNVDVLLVPVGGVSTIDARVAAEVVKRLEPRIIIPMHYQGKGLDTHLETTARFLNEMGIKEIAPQNKLSVSKSKLPPSPQVFLLDF
ncbi:MAG: MBL fold metallo-hydrolase [Chloroflexota bacterium]